MSVVDCKWVFLNKRDERSHVRKYKARLVACGLLQIKSVNYSETFAPATISEQLLWNNNQKSLLEIINLYTMGSVISSLERLFYDFVISLGFETSQTDYCMYY